MVFGLRVEVYNLYGEVRVYRVSDGISAVWIRPFASREHEVRVYRHRNAISDTASMGYRHGLGFNLWVHLG